MPSPSPAICQAGRATQYTATNHGPRICVEPCPCDRPHLLPTLFDINPDHQFALTVRTAHPDAQHAEEHHPEPSGSHRLTLHLNPGTVIDHNACVTLTVAEPLLPDLPEEILEHQQGQIARSTPILDYPGHNVIPFRLVDYEASIAAVRTAAD